MPGEQQVQQLVAATAGEGAGHQGSKPCCDQLCDQIIAGL